ncbi:hypothetical protein NDU88_001590 [Pleurodeles waltl]|uniref:Uncharacterized protein n=1 Tax=Pleurodeles waltl TaxID=8319 RepID=A0AAV7UWI4_PLEWA|nr:hypothetical protein NDU88_001590 [Pleurodeles waltl]
MRRTGVPRGIQDGGRISRLIDTTSLDHPQTARGFHSPADAADAAAGTSRPSGGPRKDRGRDGKHRRAPQEDASAALALIHAPVPLDRARSPQFPGNISWRLGCVGRPDGAEVKQDPLLLTGTAEPRSRRNQKGQKATGPRIEGAQQSSYERGPA